MSENDKSVRERLDAMGLRLPEPAAPVAAYVPARAAGGLLYVSGQIAMRDGAVWRGTLGESLATDEGFLAARACGLMLLAQADKAIGLDRVTGCLQLQGFVACTPDFTDHPRVVNGASELMQDVFGEAGRHTRAAVGCPSLPLGACVEVSGVFLLQE